MRVIVTSDVHLGSRHCRVTLFQTMLTRLAEGVDLVLAGDVIDDPIRVLEGEHKAALDLLVSQASVRKIHWIHGNHDDAYKPPGTDSVHFSTERFVDEHVYICHGDHFDNVMPYNEWFLNCFEWFHAMRIKLGAHPVHVAEFAKKFSFLYGFLRKSVRKNAVEHAQEVGAETVVCGHVHLAEDTLVNGIRYINLGAWTEPPCYCLLIDSEAIRLLPVEEAMEDIRFFTEA